MSDRPNEPMGTCSMHTDEHAYDSARCRNWHIKRPTTPVDAPPAETEWSDADLQQLADIAPAAPPQDVQDETAWLIERGGLCLGFCDYKFTWVTFTNEDALRFSRERDAYSFKECMKWPPYNLKVIQEAKITSHMWCAPAAAERPAPAQEDLELRERLAKSLWNLERNPGDAEWPKDATRQPYCKWAYAHADSLIAEFASLRRAAQAERNEWKDAVIDALTVVWALDATNESNPRKAIADLIKQECEWALDPKISQQAAKLVESGKSERQVAGENWWDAEAVDVIRHARANEPHGDWNDWQNAITNGLLRAYNRGQDSVPLPAERVSSEELAKLVASWRERAKRLDSGFYDACADELEAALRSTQQKGGE